MESLVGNCYVSFGANASFRSADVNQTCWTCNRMVRYTECNPTRFIKFLLHGITAVDETILCSFAQNTKGYMWGIAHLPPRSTGKVQERMHMRSMSPNSTKDSSVCHIADSLCTRALPSQFHCSMPCSHSSTVTAQLRHPTNPMGSLLFERHTKYAFFLEPSDIRIKWPGLLT